MVEAELRADMEALMTRFIPKEQALFDTPQHVAAAARAAAPLVDTRTIGKAPTFSGEHNY